MIFLSCSFCVLLFLGLVFSVSGVTLNVVFVVKTRTRFG